MSDTFREISDIFRQYFQRQKSLQKVLMKSEGTSIFHYHYPDF